jgi:hypothetical protein
VKVTRKETSNGVTDQHDDGGPGREEELFCDQDRREDPRVL